MKNLFVLPTDKPSRLHLAYTYSKDYYLSIESFVQLDTKNYKSFHIYITASEKEITVYDMSLLIVAGLEPMILTHHEPVKDGYIGEKIILTTDPQLIANGVQAINNDFLEWFVNNPNCEWVKVKDPLIANITDFGYKIIIPSKEEKQETLEEAADNYSKELTQVVAFYNGAKWQMDKQDDFIMGFLEFIEGTYDYSNIHDHWYLNADTSKTYSKKQLLKVYLKSK